MDYTSVLNFAGILAFLLFCNTDASCPSGWHLREGQCYHVSTGGEEVQFTWHQAREYCLENSAELASINSVSEEQFILNTVTGEFKGDAWIGLNKLSDYTEDFKWSDGTSEEYRAWAGGEPQQEEFDQCAFMNMNLVQDCFERHDGQDAIGDLVDNPNDCDGINTFCFGSQDEDLEGREWCEAECAVRSECMAYTFYSNYNDDSPLKGHCIGRNDVGELKQNIWGYAGVRISCGEGTDPSGLWFSENCGQRLGVVCKKPETSDVTAPSTALQDSYCPAGYFRVGEGNKCYSVEVFADDTSDGGGKTWDEAVQHCRNGPGINPDLASISNAHENSMIMSRIQGYTFGAWIGLHHDILTGNWIWTDNSGLSYLNWGDSPETEIGCVEMHANEESSDSVPPGTWTTRGCLSYRGWACQTFKDPENPVYTPPTTIAHDCPTGWKSEQGSCYKVDPTSRSFSSAENECKGQQAHLVAIHTASENSAVHAWAAVNDYLPMWIGLKQNGDGEYRWTDGSMDVYSNWSPGGIDGGEGCVLMELNGTWTDSNCEALHSSLCKRYSNESPVFSTPAPQEGVCPSGQWKEWGGHCYYFNTESDSNNWDDAVEECKYLAGRNFQASLVSIHSDSESLMLLQEMQDRMSGGTVWIGLSRETENDPWEWEDGSVVDYELWSPSEPNGGSGRFCVRMYTEKFAGTWDDKDCAEQHYHICKTEKIPEPTNPVVPPDGTQECPSEEWVAYDKDSCFLFRPNNRVPWTDAITECQKASQGATLASIHDYTENWYVFQQLSQRADDPSGQNNYWLGGYKEGPLSEHNFYWMDKTAWDYDYWSYGEPNDQTGSENCLEMWLDTAEWNDHGCDQARGYVCRLYVQDRTDPDGEDGSGSGVGAGAVIGIIIAVVVLVGVLGGVGYYVKQRASSGPNSSNTGTAGVNDRVVFNNPLSKEEDSYDKVTNDNLYDNAPTAFGTSQHTPNVQDGVLHFGTEA